MVEIKNLFVSYGENVILKGVDLSVLDGEIVCVTGASGAGKTTLLNAISGLVDYSGEIKGANSVSYVFQTPRLIGDLTAFKNVKLVANNKSDWEIYDALTLAEIGHKANEKAKHLSGGEKQRLQISRAVLHDAPVFLFDEPFSSLDFLIKKDLLKIVKKLAKNNNKSVIFVTHDIAEAAILSDKLAVIKDGVLSEFKFEENLKESEKLNKIYNILSYEK